MTRKLTRGAAALGPLGGVLATLAGGGQPAAAATLIQSCPFTAMQPGTYVLARDLSCPGVGVAVSVQANDVNLVLGGRTLSGARVGVQASGVTGLNVVGGILTGSRNGLSLDSTP